MPAGLAVAALLAGVTATSGAQQRPGTVTTIQKTDLETGRVTEVPINDGRRSAFNLFAAEDQAVGGLRVTGALSSALYNFGGPHPVYADQGGPNIGAALLYNTNSRIFFEMGFIGGAPISEFRKIRAVHPAVGTMRGSFGYSVMQWNRITGNVTTQNWGPADGQFGRLFAGVTTTSDASCRNLNNNQNAFVPAGLTALAMLDCPETWPASGFQGKLVVPDSVWRQRFAADPANFRWDDWRIPRSNLETNNFLGSQSTYGVSSDFFREQRLRYGSVVRGGSGSPQIDGYPLGLELRLDSYQFGSPAARNTIFYQITMVNRSADVYGGAVDYDSLYFGFAPGFVFYGQGPEISIDLQQNAALVHGGNLSDKCNATYPKRWTNATTLGCVSTTNKQNEGIFAIQWLKSPLGDMRNKLFSNPQSAYYNPNSPLADDTLTFNHLKPNQFGTTSLNVSRSMRSAFGMISSTEENYLDGRSPTEFGTPAQFVFLFTPENWDGSVSPATARFNRFVPGTTINPKSHGQLYGKWDYNNDGIQDTISMPHCGAQGCAGVYSDTIAGGYRNAFGNIQNTMSAGPFRLRAGDTTQFLIAFTWASDTTAMNRLLPQVTQTYLSNYEGPASIQLAPIVLGRDLIVESAELRDSILNRNLTGGQPSSTTPGRVTIRPPRVNPNDAFLQREVARIRRDSVNGDPNVRRVLRLNPGILDSVSRRAADNLAELLIFKSCDGGVTYTTGSGISGVVGTAGVTCQSTPTRNVDAGTIAFPFAPRFRVPYVNGVPQTATLTDDVQSGRSYLYSFVTRSRGLRDLRVVDSVGGRLVATDLQVTLGLPIDTINASIARSGPTALTVYVPVSLPAARSFARIDTSIVLGTATQRVTIENVSNAASGRYRAIFANQFIVRRTTDTVTNVSSTTVQAQVVLPAAATATGNVTNLVAREYTFTTAGNVPVFTGTAGATATQVTGTLRSTTGTTRLFIDTVRSAAGRTGYVLVNDSTRAAVFVAGEQFATGLAEAQVASPLFPGFTVVPGDSANATTGFRTEVLTTTGATRDRNFVLRAPGDTLTVEARQFLPQFLPGVVAPQRRVRGGTYDLTWLTDPFGPGAPFTLGTPEQTQTALSASLAQVARLATTVTDTSARTAALVGATAARPLVRVRVPFVTTFRDAATGQLDTVRFAMLRRTGPTANTRLLGSGADTLRVTVPDSLWLPGDTLIALQRVERDSSVLVGTTRFTVVRADNVNGVAGFTPIRVLSDSVGIARFFVGCNTGINYSGVRPLAADQATCNPLAILSRGASPNGGYLPVATGWRQVFELTRTFEAGNVLALTATPFRTDNAVTQQSLARVRVVPNPYVVRSEFDAVDGNRAATARLLFAGVPQSGVVRIYTISGQLVQEITWTRADLENIGNGNAVGDLPWNLRSREGLDVGSGLYIYVLQANESEGDRLQTRGKFAIIR
jgi:hypothetical protein